MDVVVATVGVVIDSGRGDDTVEIVGFAIGSKNGGGLRRGGECDRRHFWW